MNARKCQWCNTWPCPQPAEDGTDVFHQWLNGQLARDMPCWTPFPANVGVVHDEHGQLIALRAEAQP